MKRNIVIEFDDIFCDVSFALYNTMLKNISSFSYYMKDPTKLMTVQEFNNRNERNVLKYVARDNLNNVDILKVGHHGSNTSSCEEFLAGIEGKIAVISVGENNKFGHPNDNVLENLENSKIYRTDENGSIMFKLKNNKLKIKYAYHRKD